MAWFLASICGALIDKYPEVNPFQRKLRESQSFGLAVVIGFQITLFHPSEGLTSRDSVHLLPISELSQVYACIDIGSSVFIHKEIV